MNPHKFHYFRGLLLICLLAAQNAFAQQSDSLRTTSKPTILVLDSETRQPIQDALLSYAKTTITADSTGIIRLPSVPRRQEILKISALGYTTQALHWQDLTLSGGQRIVPCALTPIICAKQSLGAQKTKSRSTPSHRKSTAGRSPLLWANRSPRYSKR